MCTLSRVKSNLRYTLVGNIKEDILKMCPTIVNRLTQEAAVPWDLTQQFIESLEVCFFEIERPAFLDGKLLFAKAGGEVNSIMV